MPKDLTTDRPSKKKEWLVMLFIIFVFFPILSVLVVGGYGFAVWFWQMFVAGPPTA